ncbi:hypothetical protein KVV02_005180 [Mortierella alpina]|uniref:Uncharacterized protein n=1 Tax=Mortierella alpina TaxID=64518 RepID=A0A9P8A9I9_MORAP|nr:hypothetical protein KVV02_005180 [Mortierella alpina]
MAAHDLHPTHHFLPTMEPHARFHTKSDNPAPADNKVIQRSAPQPIDTTVGHNFSSNNSTRPVGSSLLSPSESGSVLSSPPPPYPPHAATAAAVGLDQLGTMSPQCLSTLSASPAKLDHLQGLMSSLRSIINDQFFATGDLKTQLHEIQEVLDRVDCIQDKLTLDERRVVQDAQMMKDLAADVIAAKFASNGSLPESQRAQLGNPPLALSMLSVHNRRYQPTEAPPPTATTPPPSAFHVGYLRHSSSATSLTSSSNTTDGHYTHDSEDPPSSRPSSVNSSNRRQQKKKRSRQSLRQLEPLSGMQGSSHQEEESNAAFERICSLLTHLITDASTAVSTTPDGSQKTSTVPLPQFSPLVASDSESSADSASDDDEKITNVVNGANHGGSSFIRENSRRQSRAGEQEIDFVTRLQGPEGAPNMDELELEVEVEPVRSRYRTGLRTRQDKPTKRLSSLFLELQNTQQLQEDDTLDEEHLYNNDLPSSSSTREGNQDQVKIAKSQRRSLSLSQSSELGRAFTTPAITEDSHDLPRNAPGHCSTPSQTLTPRASMASLVLSQPQTEQFPDTAEKQSRMNADSDLDRTVETMDGLARDLVAVATHQNWMQIKLQKTLQFQKQQVERIENAHSTREIESSSEITSCDVTSPLQGHIKRSSNDSGSSGQHPLVDLSRSLKQVAISVGKVLASNTSKHKPANQKRLESMDGTGHRSSQSGRFSGKDFSRYFKELEKIAALGGKIGFGRADDNGLLNGDLSGELQDKNQDHLDKNRFSRSSFTTVTNASNRNSAASTLIFDADFATTYADPKQDKASLDEDKASQRNQSFTPVSHSRRGSTSDAPELEDFAAQCRLLTRALVLPFVQLTHHAMTSQDSALALTPRSSKFVDPSYELDSTLDIVENLERSEEHFARATSPSSSRSSSTGYTSLPGDPSFDLHHPRDASQQQASVSNSNTPLSLAGRDLDSLLKRHSELSPDAIVKAKAFASTGLYLIHLIYWTVLFVIGTLVLDPWLAETAGHQVVKIMDQVRDTIAGDGPPQNNNQGALVNQDDGHPGYQISPAIDSVDDGNPSSVYRQNRRDGVQEDSNLVDLRQPQHPAHENRAIKAAAGFETLKQRLGSSPATSHPDSRPVSGLWSGDSQPSASAMSRGASMATLTQPMAAFSNGGRESPVSVTSTAMAMSTSGGASVMRTVSWVGPRRRRIAKDGNTSRVRRFSSTRTMNLTLEPPKDGSSHQTTPATRESQQRTRPVSHAETSSSTTLPELAFSEKCAMSAPSQAPVASASWLRQPMATESPTLKYLTSRRKSL